MPAKQICILVLFSILAITAFSEGIHWYAGIGGGWGVATTKYETGVSVFGIGPEYQNISYWFNKKDISSLRFAVNLQAGVFLTPRFSVGLESFIMQEGGSKIWSHILEPDPMANTEDYVLIRHTTLLISANYYPFDLGLYCNFNGGYGGLFLKETITPPGYPSNINSDYGDGFATGLALGYDWPIWKGLRLEAELGWFLLWFTEGFDGIRSELGLVTIGIFWTNQE